MNFIRSNKLMKALAVLLLLSAVLPAPFAQAATNAVGELLSCNYNCTNTIVRNTDGTIAMNGHQLPRIISWSRSNKVGNDTAYTLRDQDISVDRNSLDWENVEYGTYRSVYTGFIGNVIRVKVEPGAMYNYYYSSKSNGQLSFSTEMVDGRKTPTALTANDHAYLIFLAHSAQVVDLDWDKNYWYYGNKESRSFEKGDSFNLATLTIPNQPTNVNVYKAGTEASFRWDHTPQAVQYEVEFDGVQQGVVTLPLYTAPQLAANTSHTFRVRAINQKGVGPWSEMVTMVTQLATPSQLRATAKLNEVTWQWDAVPGATVYEVRTSTGEVINVGATQSYTMTNLTANQLYWLSVRALADGNDGMWSQPVSAKTAPLPPTAATAYMSNGAAQLTWSASTGATAYELELDGQLVTVNGLTYAYNGEQTMFTVRAKHETGVSEWKAFTRVTDALKAAQVNVHNYKAGIDDEVHVTNIATGDVVRVYNSSTGSLLGQQTVTSSTVQLKVGQLGEGAGTVNVSLQKVGAAEGAKANFAYTSEVSPQPSANDITVKNNFNSIVDEVKVSKLQIGDTIKVYSTQSGSPLLGSAVAETDEAIVRLPQLSVANGALYVSVTKYNKVESKWTLAYYLAEPKTAPLAATTVTVRNNKAGIDDVISVKDVQAGDKLVFYNAKTDGQVVASGTVKADETTLELRGAQLFAGGGYLYATKQRPNEHESERVAISYESELTYYVAQEAITITNNYVGIADEIKVTRLAVGDVVNVYSAATNGTLLATGTSLSSEVTIKVPQLSVDKGTVYVSNTAMNKLESSRTAKAYSAEPVTPSLMASAVKVDNNRAGIADTITISGLNEGDKISVQLQGVVAPIASGTVGAGATSITFTVPQLGVVSGYLYVTYQKVNLHPSVAIAVIYPDEKTAKIHPTTVTVNNYYVGTNDNVKVTDLQVGAIVNVYNAATAGTLLGSATATTSEVNIAIAQIGSAAGTIYVSVTNPNKLESDRVAIAHASEPVSPYLPQAAIVTTNNKAGVNDTVEVSQVTAGDVLYVYRDSAGGTPIATATVAANATSAVISIPQLSVNAGTIHVSVKKPQMLESARMYSTYTSEMTPALYAGNAIVTNNYVGTADTVRVVGLKQGDVVTLYNASTGGTVLASGTVQTNEVILTVQQLGVTPGTFYMTLTNVNKLESQRTAVAFGSEPVTPTPKATNVFIENNKVGIDDVIVVKEVKAGDEVKVYMTSNGGVPIVSAIVPAGSTAVTMKVPQLTAYAANAYVSVTTMNMLESKRLAVAYLTEVTQPLTSSYVRITNNYVGTDDVIQVNYIQVGDEVKVYSAPTGGQLLATAVAADSGLLMKVSQLGTTAGKVYVTLTRPNKLESTRTEIAYGGEPVTPAVSPSAIQVTNNKGTDDTIVVNYLAVGDEIKVYLHNGVYSFLASAIVQPGTMAVTIAVPQLSVTEGYIYVTVKRANMGESVGVPIGYRAEPK